MNFIEMRTEVELLYESINSSALLPGFTDTEWGQLLTMAQRKVVKNILDEGITKSTFNQLAIELLVKPDVFSTFVDSNHFRNIDSTGTLAKVLNPSGAEIIRLAKFFWILDEYGVTVLDNNIPLKRITFDFYRANKENPFRIPSITEGYWVVQYNNLPVFITDGAVITEYHIVGVHNPDLYPINSTGGECKLNVGVHYKIVEEAVTLARMANSDQIGYQMAVAELNK